MLRTLKFRLASRAARVGTFETVIVTELILYISSFLLYSASRVLI